jgi:hypothetical protein
MVNISGKNRKIGLSLLVGLLGGAMGFIEGEAAKWEGMDNLRGEYYGHFSVPAGVISGFLFCFLLSLLYLKFIKNRRSRLGWGALFGLSSGGLCGLTVSYALK